METSIKTHAKNVINFAPKLLFGSAALYLISFWFAPFSFNYFLGTVIMALVFTCSTILYWKIESGFLSGIFFAIAVIGQSQIIIYAWDLDWTLVLELLALYLTVTSSMMVVFNSRIKHYLGIASDLNSDVMPDRTN